MTTLVGTQSSINDAIYSLIELEYNAFEAYKEAIERIKNDDYRKQLETFKSDHKRHIDDLTQALRDRNVTPPEGPTVKKWLTTGKVVWADMSIFKNDEEIDQAILGAMLSNEGDTNTAYERMHQRSDLWDGLKEILENAFKDEKRHKQWLEEKSKS